MTRTLEPTFLPFNSEVLVDLVAECLDIPADQLERSVPLVRYGLDSLSAVQLTAAIATELNRDVPEWLLLDHPDIDSLEGFLAGTAAESDSCASIPSCLDQMLADCVLPQDIRPASPPSNDLEPRSVLVTGATGFFGGHLLATLLRRTDATIYCLVRPQGAGETQKRIRDNLNSSGLWQSEWASRLTAVEGDLFLPRFGLSPIDFDYYSRHIDVIYHCAAAVKWGQPYSALRDVNVLGTKELLKLACNHRQKTLHFISSISVCYSTTGPAKVTEEDDMAAHLRGIHLGYAQTKCVAETLVRQASERGLRVTIHRPSLISGDSQSGVFNRDDFITLMIQGCVDMGSAPDLDWELDCCPVDYAAESIFQLTQAGTKMTTFHLANPSKRSWREVVLWMNVYGYPIRMIPYKEWLSRMEESSQRSDHPLHTLRSFFLCHSVDDLSLPELYEQSRCSRATDALTRNALAGHNVACPPLDANLLEKYFDRFVSEGLLPPVARQKSDRKPSGMRLDRQFFEQVFRDFYQTDSLRVTECTPLSSPIQDSVITELTTWSHETFAGLSQHRIRLASNATVASRALEVFVKAKPKDSQVLAVASSVANLCGETVGQEFARFKHRIGLSHSHIRELAIYEQRDPRFRNHLPLVYGIARDDSKQQWVMVLERLAESELMKVGGDAAGWAEDQIEAALHGIAQIHSVWYGRERELLRMRWLGDARSVTSMTTMRSLWFSLAQYAQRFFSQWGSVHEIQQSLISSLPEWWRLLDQMPQTLTHNDFNPRNIALRKSGSGYQLCLFDWELAAVGVPQHDLAELLCFVLEPTVPETEAQYYIDLHRQLLSDAVGSDIDAGSWKLGFQLSLCDLIINRFPMYCLVHTVRPQRYLERVLRTWRSLYTIFCSDLPFG